MERFRPLLFWTFVVLFLITVSSVLFYTFGYRFNFARGIFIYTGSISIKSNPETVDIEVDGELIPHAKLGILNNSIHISGLIPGEHFIEVSAPDYQPWSKKTIIQSGLSTEFWNVFLIKENNTLEYIPETADAIKIFQAREKGLSAIAKKKDGLFTVAIFDVNDKTNEQVFSLSDVTLPEDGQDNIEWSPDDKKLLIPVEQADGRNYFVVDIATKQITSLYDITKLKIGTLRDPRWDPANRNFILYISNDTLNRIETGATDAAPLFVKENVKAYNFSGQDIYYLSQDNGIIYRLPAMNVYTEPTQITTVPIDMASNDPYTLILYDDTRLTVREQKTGKLWVYNKISPTETTLKAIAENNVKGVQFSDDGKKLLFFTDNEISVYFLRDWEAQPVRLSGTIIQIARFSNAVKNITWSEDYEHIIFSLNNTAKLIELDNRDRRNMANLATFPLPLLQILPRFDENFIYFVAPQNEGGDAVSRIRLSEPSTFLGL